MLVINENDMRLLNMKRKLLEVSTNNIDDVLADYEELAKRIDNECYNQIVNEAKNVDFNNLSFEEQISLLSSIEEDYNYLNQLQWMIRNTYSKYTDNEIKLLDINNILIDNIVERISDIQGYLINIKNLNSNKMEIERLNNQLILLDKENDQAKKLMISIKNKIKDDIIAAEGRTYSERGNIEPISIVSEFKRYGIDLKNLLDNQELLQKQYEKFKSEKETQEEMLEVTSNLPNKDEDIYKQMEFETIESQYKFLLIELINEVCYSSKDYNLFKNNIYKIADTILAIKDCLQKLNIKFYINPFDRIKIDNHIHTINSMVDYQKEISDVKKTITYITSMIEETENKNKELVISLGNDINIIKEKDSVVLESNSTYDEETLSDIFEAKDNEIKDNQVVRISDYIDAFKIDRAREKTDGVIRRVYEMINSVPVASDNIKNPELIVEPVMEEKIIDDKAETKDTVPQEVDLSLPQVGDTIDDLIVDNSNEIFLDKKSTETISNGDGLFKEVKPFEETPLFSDRYDSGIFESKNDPKMVIDLSKGNDMKTPFEETPKVIKFDEAKGNNIFDMTMPDAFWVTKEEKSNMNDEKILSFDEQVEALMNNNEHGKTK